MSQILFSLIVFALMIIVLVGFHEFGHFWIARRVGIKVLRFSIGFGKPLWKWYDKKGTEFVIAIIPLGGYVKMLDEREAPVATQEKHLAYNRQNIAKRLAVVTAGPIFNIILALIIYWVAFAFGVIQVIPRIGQVASHSIAEQAGMHEGEIIVNIAGDPVKSWPAITLKIIQRLGTQGQLQLITQDKNNQFHQYQLSLAHWTINHLKPDPTESLGIIPYRPPEPAKFSRILVGSPAAKAGLLPNDQVISINKNATNNWENFNKQIKATPGQTVSFTILRGQQTLNLPVTLGSSRTWYGKLQGWLGVEEIPVVWPPASTRIVSYPVWYGWWPAIKEVGFFTKFNLIVVQKMITGVISLKSLGGPFSLFKGSLIAANNGVIAYLVFLAFISISLAIVNLLPIPGLDGSQIIYLLIEAMRGKPVSLALQVLLFRLGVIALILLLVQATLNDFARLI